MSYRNPMSYRNAAFPGTFDPITLGHLDIIERAASLFDQLTVAVAESRGKNTRLSLDKRVALAKKSCHHLSNVKVVGFSSLLENFLKLNQINVLVRGLRSVTDYDYEMQLCGMYCRAMPQLEIVMLQSRPELACISSTLVRELKSFNAEIRPYVPDAVAMEFA